MVRILHISDLHAKVVPEGDHEGAEQERLVALLLQQIADQERIVAALLRDVAEQDQATAFDLVIFSGDLAHDGSKRGLERGRELLLDPLRAVLPDRHIVLVSGNHDVDRAAISDVFELGLRQKLVTWEGASEVVRSPSDFAQAIRRLSNWNDFHGEWYVDTAEVSAADPLAFLHRIEIGGASVGVAAVIQRGVRGATTIGVGS